MYEKLKDKTEKIDANFNLGKELFNYFFNTILTNAEKIKLKSLKIYSQFKAWNNMNKKNNNINNININNKKNNIQINNNTNKNEINNANNNSNNNKETKNINNYTINENHISIVSEIENSNRFLEKYTVEYTGDNNDIYIAMKKEKVEEEKKSEEKTKTKKNKIVKLSPEVVKKINYKEFFVKDKVKKEQKNNSNSPTNTTSSSPSSNLTANNSGNPIISVQTDKKNGDWILTSCHEINISFINKK